MIVLSKECPALLWEKWKALKIVQDQCSRTDLSGNQLWKLASKKSKRYVVEGQKIVPTDVLRTHLITQQNGICCYCGSLLKGDITRIEHLNPKETYSDKVFEYENLFASCSGGAFTKTPHIVTEDDETIETIAKKFNRDVSFLIELNRDWIENIDGTRQESASALYDRSKNRRLNFAKLKKGTKIYHQHEDFFHCDNRKGSEQINIQPIPTDGLLYSTKPEAKDNPFVYSCANKIAYEEVDGSIVVDTLFEYSINDVLGLNIDKLKRKRKKTFNDAKKNYQTIEADCGNDKQLLVEKLEQAIKRLEQANGIAFKFVDIYYLQQKLKQLQLHKT